MSDVPDLVDTGGDSLVAVPVTQPVPGDVNYVDHVQLALSRLPEQFKRRQNS